MAARKCDTKARAMPPFSYWLLREFGSGTGAVVCRTPLFDLVLDFAERRPRVADTKVVHPTPQDGVHLRNRHWHRQVAAPAQDLPDFL
jgi:hypothetical protein